MTIFPAGKILQLAQILRVQVFKKNACSLNICVDISHITMWHLRKTPLEYRHMVLLVSLSYNVHGTTEYIPPVSSHLDVRKGCWNDGENKEERKDRMERERENEG